MAARYPDMFRNALMTSHEMTLRGELWPVGANAATVVEFASGSVSCDRNAMVRRSANVNVDPRLAPQAVTDALTPYGALMKIFRGVRYANGQVEEYPIFHGRIEAVDDSLDSLSVRCSDRAADIVDARFDIKGRTAPYNVACKDFAVTLITEVLPGVVVHVNTASTALTTRAMSWDRERGDALNDLSTAMGAEWYADTNGEFYIANLPAAITDTTPAVWVVDSGDSGVTVGRTQSMDRQGVFNEVYVTGEAVGGPLGAQGHWIDANPSSPTRYGGPFGKVPTFYTGQAAHSTAEANDVAQRIGLQLISKARAVQVTCVPNPQLRLGDVVRVQGLSTGIDGMYYVQSMDIPLDAESPMTMVLGKSLTPDPSLGVHGYRDAALRVPVGVQWP